MMVLLNAVDAAVRAWTRLYTWGLPEALRERRRAEIDSDLWESLHDAAPGSDLAQAAHILTRLVIGIPDDLSWRAEHGSESRKPHRKAVAWGTTAAVLLGAGFWLFTILSSGPMPVPPVAPSTRLVFGVDLRMLPPPPPPPPPPPGMKSSWPPAPPPPPPPDPQWTGGIGR